MIIYQPEITTTETHCILNTTFESLGKTETLWYKTTLEYQSFLVTETADAALVGLLVLAMKNGEDIKIKAKVSAKLLYTLNTYLIPAFALSNPEYQPIKITSETVSHAMYVTNKVAATGISCGIDSFSTLATHLDNTSGHAVQYLTHFNAGSHGLFGGEIAERIYKERLNRIKDFAKRANLPLIEVDSNVLDVVGEDFQKLHSIYHLSCVLALQKGISVYFYASAFRFDYFKLNKNDTSDWDTFLLKMIETETLSFYSSMAQYSRFERTEIVSKYKPSYQFLDVCIAPIHAEKTNCSKCEKCLRTQVTLELLGQLELYKDVFDLEVYKAHKNQYISRLIANKDANQINKDIYLKLKENNEITSKHYVLNCIPALKKTLYKLKKKLR
ncbi:hypothetical protein [Lacinutrix salivirga]